jgi:hypothetical protein
VSDKRSGSPSLERDLALLEEWQTNYDYELEHEVIVSRAKVE